jgi:hypothetical protein
LFHNQSELIIDENNVRTFTYLAQALDNIPLLIKCFKSASTQQIFTLSSKSFRFLPHHYKKSLNDFTLIINGQTFELNYSLLCCLCAKFKQMESLPTELTIQVPNEHFKCFIHFLNIFNGISFNFQLFSFSSLLFLIDLFGISPLFQFISSSIPLSSNIKESIEFLSIKGCEHFDKIFNHSITILTQHFEEITIDQFNYLTNFTLEMIFTNEELQYENENYLFDIVAKLIDKDPKRKELLKMINFSFVSSSSLKQFFEDFPLDEIDFDLFSSLKGRLLHDISKSDLLPTRRRRKTLNILSQQKIDEFFQIIRSNFGEIFIQSNRQKI